MPFFHESFQVARILARLSSILPRFMRYHAHLCAHMRVFLRFELFFHRFHQFILQFHQISFFILDFHFSIFHGCSLIQMPILPRFWVDLGLFRPILPCFWSISAIFGSFSLFWSFLDISHLSSIWPSFSPFHADLCAHMPIFKRYVGLGEFSFYTQIEVFFLHLYCKSQISLDIWAAL